MEADFQRFFGLEPLKLSWRRFRTLIFSLVSQESAFYAPFLADMYEEMREEAEANQSRPSNKENRIKINLDTALEELGGVKENIEFNG